MPKSFKEIKSEFVAGAKVAGRKTNNPVIVAMVGVSGSGNSTIARELKRRTGWPIIEKNKIRVALREKGRGFNPANTDEIHYAMLGKILKSGGNVILDSDFAERAKRAKLQRFSRRFRAKVAYLRLTCDRDITIRRILGSRYDPKTDIFENAAVALREHTRRLPWHYRWSEANGGQYTLRRLPIKFLAEIDTTDPLKWRKKVRLVADRLHRW